MLAQPSDLLHGNMSDNLKLRLAEDVATLHDGRIRLLPAVRPTEHGAGRPHSGRPHSGRPHSGRPTQVDLFLWRYNMRQFETVLFGCAVALLFGFGSVAAAEPTILKLWPSTPPGQKTGDGNERDTSQPGQGFVAGKSVIRLGHVSDPTITVYRAPEENNSRVAVLICPGGGYQILAYDLEGTEVAEWFNSIGVTAVLLKYRVPRVDGGTPPIEPLQDAQRALSLVRQHAEQWQFDPEKVGEKFAAVLTQEADGSFSINCIVQSNGAVTAALTAFYAAEQAAFKAAQSAAA